MPCQGEHVGKPATYGHTIGFLLGTHDHWRNYCGSPSDWIQTSHKKLAAVTNRPWYIFGRTNQPIAWEHAAQTNPYRISIHRRALDSGHIALCHLWATKWLCSRDFLFQNARNDPFLWTCMTGLRWWWLRHSMYPQNLEKKQVFKKTTTFYGWNVLQRCILAAQHTANFLFPWLAVIFGCSARCFESWPCKNSCLDLFRGSGTIWEGV